MIIGPKTQTKSTHNVSLIADGYTAPNPLIFTSKTLPASVHHSLPQLQKLTPTHSSPPDWITATVSSMVDHPQSLKKLRYIQNFRGLEDPSLHHPGLSGP